MACIDKVSADFNQDWEGFQFAFLAGILSQVDNRLAGSSVVELGI